MAAGKMAFGGKNRGDNNHGGYRGGHGGNWSYGGYRGNNNHGGYRGSRNGR